MLRLQLIFYWSTRQLTRWLLVYKLKTLMLLSLICRTEACAFISLFSKHARWAKQRKLSHVIPRFVLSVDFASTKLVWGQRWFRKIFFAKWFFSFRVLTCKLNSQSCTDNKEPSIKREKTWLYDTSTALHCTALKRIKIFWPKISLVSAPLLLDQAIIIQIQVDWLRIICPEASH